MPTKRIFSIPVYDTSALLAIACDDAIGISVGLLGDMPNASLTFLVVLEDPEGNVVGVLGPFTVLTGAKPDWKTFKYLGVMQDGTEPAWHLIGPAVAYVKVLSPLTGVDLVKQLGWRLSASLEYPANYKECEES